MKSTWFLGSDKSYDEDVRKEYASSAIMRKRLVDMLEKKKGEAHAASLSKDAYSSPNWGFLQADAVGFQRALDEVIKLL